MEFNDRELETIRQTPYDSYPDSVDFDQLPLEHVPTLEIVDKINAYFGDPAMYERR